MPSPLIGTPLLICGCERSGTTLLATLLDGHSQLLVYPGETFFFQLLRAPSPRTNDEWIEAFLNAPECRKIAATYFEKVPHPPVVPFVPPSFDEALFDSTFRALGAKRGRPEALLAALVEAYGVATGQIGRRYWVEKTPYTERYLDDAEAWLGRPVVIYTLRDPRAVYSSMSRKGAQQGDASALDVASFAEVWRESLEAWERWSSRRGRRGHVVRYEALAQDPRGTMEEVSAFLGLPFEEALTIPWKGAQPYTGNSAFEPALHRVSRSPVERWRTVLAPEVVAELEGRLADEMERYGYSLTVPDAPRYPRPTPAAGAPPTRREERASSPQAFAARLLAGFRARFSATCSGGTR